MKNIKAIMCDVDGTLLTDDGVVSPFTIEMIKRDFVWIINRKRC